MEHPCEQCGAAVEDGRPFCPHCRAPQIHVKVEMAPQLASGATMDAGVAIDALSPSERRASSGPSLFRSAWRAGLLGVVANLIPYGFGLVLPGMFAVFLHRRAGEADLRSGRAARLGAMAGGISFVLTQVLKILLLHEEQEYRDLMRTSLERMAGNPDPAVQAMLQWAHTQEGFAVLLALSLVVALILAMLLSAVGGLIGASIQRGRSRPPL